MSDTELTYRDVPTDPENWTYLGNHGDYLHFWTYEKGGKAVYECYIKHISGNLHKFRLMDNISGDKLAGRDITDINVALDFADKMMQQIVDHDEIQNHDFNWPDDMHD